jgi:hypothetical protein
MSFLDGIVQGLKRTANDFSSFAHKTVPAGSDVVLLEDSAAGGVKKFSTLTELVGVGAGVSGDLAGALPSPTVAAVHETAGPTKLTIGSVQDGQLIQRSGTALVGTTPAAAVGSVTGGVWLPEAPPLSAHADNHEFAGASKAAWTIFDPLALGFAVADQSPTWLKTTVPFNATTRLLAYWRACPPEAEWSIWAKISPTWIPATGSFDCDLMVMEGSSTTTKWAGIRSQSSGTTTLQVTSMTWANYNSGPVAFGTPNNLVTATTFLRFGYDGTSFFAYWSVDGVMWFQLGTVAKTFTPVNVGFAFNNTQNSGTKYAYVDFYRVEIGAGSATYAANPFGGRLI